MVNIPAITFDRSVLEYKIHRVYCRNAEDEWFDGDDNMFACGVHGEADAQGNLLLQALEEFGLETFKDGQTRDYNPPIPLATMDIKRNLDFPKYFQLNLALAERDLGEGFKVYIESLLDGIDYWFRQYMLPFITSTVAGALTGGGAGSVVPL